MEKRKRSESKLYPLQQHKLEDFALRARQARKKLRYSMNDIAEKSGYSQHIISLFERGLNNNGYLVLIYLELMEELWFTTGEVV